MNQMDRSAPISDQAPVDVDNTDSPSDMDPDATASSPETVATNAYVNEQDPTPDDNWPPPDPLG